MKIVEVLVLDNFVCWGGGSFVVCVVSVLEKC